jgi:hypothetical protein
MRKTPYDLCENCRWHCDLQLSYSKFYACVYKILEFFNFEQWISNTFRPKHRRVTTSRAPARRPASASAPRTAQGHTPAVACPFPMRPAIGVLPTARTPRTAPYRLCRRRLPYARRPRLPWHSRFFKVMPSSAQASRPYLNRVPAPPRVAITVCRATHAATGELTSPSILQCAQSSLNLPWTQ